MGQRFAPSYANLYMSEWEREALTKCPLLPTLYLRYLDDIFGIWTHTIEHYIVQHFQSHPVSHLIISGLETNNC
ncbi:hypothetical protein D4764_11G0007480 [Takifugu flavidus]|uniref:Reverse transcriptase domain-containing protein n=1 Tax=Takifugu flavidus TaxID=433684 RepID=A0A5C6PJX2_9TELE|nr:hypothetical protein D4764_11G0007480 [Takifugu flavidus]